ncbi:predicted protein [Plenodomus lingam JN3]|uniref:Predicted protein n=1 Tax=Leptosphaeria maculans (strain JN3 / isolate v23.1.3 / race Av1-4-5-6-7-8) TaxID=985895 RepID=E4ZWZ4_LEPMJ|nr:predicted protein [Plenodomus lingam JN3]CBX95204.1 predicted protein [Plenodomus lingam JN3]
MAGPLLLTALVNSVALFQTRDTLSARGDEEGERKSQTQNIALVLLGFDGCSHLSALETSTLTKMTFSQAANLHVSKSFPFAQLNLSSVPAD